MDKTNFTHKRHFKTSFSLFWNKSHLFNFWKFKLNHFNSNLIINLNKLMSIHIPDLCGKYKKCQNIDLEVYIIIQTTEDISKKGHLYLFIYIPFSLLSLLPSSLFNNFVYFTLFILPLLLSEHTFWMPLKGEYTFSRKTLLGKIFVSLNLNSRKFSRKNNKNKHMGFNLLKYNYDG